MDRCLFSILIILVALAFRTGLPLSIGVGDSFIKIPVPQSEFIFNFLVAGAFVWLIPPWIVARIDKNLKLSKRIKDLTEDRIKKIVKLRERK